MSKKGTKRLPAETKIAWFLANYHAGLTGRELVEASQKQFGDGLGKGVQRQLRDALAARDSGKGKKTGAVDSKKKSRVIAPNVDPTNPLDPAIFDRVATFMQQAREMGVKTIVWSNGRKFDL